MKKDKFKRLRLEVQTCEPVERKECCAILFSGMELEIPERVQLSFAESYCRAVKTMADGALILELEATLFVSFLCIKLARFAGRQEGRKLLIPVHFILDEFPNIGIVPDFKKKLVTAGSRDMGMSILYQNIPQLQNRYPDGRWEEILGGCDISLFLGCCFCRMRCCGFLWMRRL